MRLLLSLTLIAATFLTACQPIMPTEALAAFAPQRLHLTQSVATAFDPIANENPFVINYPALRTAAAPTWLRPGTRVIYRMGSAAIARTRDDTPSSGEGLVEYDVIAQNRRNVVFLSSLINTQIPGTPPSALSSRAELPGIGEFWFSPTVLRNAEDAAAEDYVVTRMPIEVEGATYNVVRIESNTATDQGSDKDVWAFDAKTGLLVSYNHATYRLDGSMASGITMSLLGRRQVRLPWRSGAVPDWVRPGLELQFSGSQTLDVGVGQPTTLPMSSVSRVTSVGALWSTQSQQAYLYGRDAGGGTGATGVMQLFGGMWLPETEIAALETGTVLDQDPITGIVTSVVQADNQQVVLAATGPGFVNQLYYDASDGRLFGIYLEQHTPTGSIYTSLQAVQ